MAAIVHFMLLEHLGLIADDGGMTVLGDVLKDSPRKLQELQVEGLRSSITVSIQSHLVLSLYINYYSAIMYIYILYEDGGRARELHALLPGALFSGAGDDEVRYLEWRTATRQ